jgi:hypothetical protein
LRFREGGAIIIVENEERDAISRKHSAEKSLRFLAEAPIMIVDNKEPIHMKKLEKQFTSKGFEFNQVLRKGNMAIYEKGRAESSNKSYELIYIKSHNGYEIAGNKIPPSEIYPSDSSWGTYGWTYITFDEAKSKFDEKLKLVTENENDKSTKRERKKRSAKGSANNVTLTCPVTNQSRKAPYTYLESKAKRLNASVETVVKYYISREGLKKLRKGEIDHPEKENLLTFNGKGE